MIYLDQDEKLTYKLSKSSYLTHCTMLFLCFYSFILNVDTTDRWWLQITIKQSADYFDKLIGSLHNKIPEKPKCQIEPFTFF